MVLYKDHHFREYENGLVLLTVNLKSKNIECDVQVVATYEENKPTYQIRVDYVDPDWDGWDWEFADIKEDVNLTDYYSHFTNLNKDQFTILFIPHKMMKYKKSYVL